MSDPGSKARIFGRKMHARVDNNVHPILDLPSIVHIEHEQLEAKSSARQFGRSLDDKEGGTKGQRLSNATTSITSILSTSLRILWLHCGSGKLHIPKAVA